MNLPPEIWSTIAEAIDAGSDWKSFIFTCQLFSQFNNDKKIIHFANPLATLIKRLPNHDWDWLSIVNNPWMNDDIIEKIASFPTFKPTKEAILVQLDGYNSQILLINNNDSTIMDFTNVSIDMIRKYHPRKRLHGLSAVADLELILANPDLNWVWKEVSKNPNITWQIVKTYIDFEWDYIALIKNKNITLDIVINNYITFYVHLRKVLINTEPVWDMVSEYLVLRPGDLERNIPWNYFMLSRNPSLSLQYVIDNPELGWKPLAFTHHPQVTRAVLNALPDVPPYCFNRCRFEVSEVTYDPDNPFNWSNISGNPWTPPELIKNNLNKPWNYVYLSQNPALTLELAKLLRDKLEWFLVSQAYWVNLDVVKANPELPWDWQGLSYNSNITFLDVLRNPDLPWKYTYLSRNKFGKNLKTIINGLPYCPYWVS